jgi:hypothetical protein
MVSRDSTFSALPHLAWSRLRIRTDSLLVGPVGRHAVMRVGDRDRIEKIRPRSAGRALALSQLSVVMKSPAQPKPMTARGTSQGGGPTKSGMAAVAATTRPAKAA